MNSSLIRSLPVCSNRVGFGLGLVTQKRNHARIYPWRFNRMNRQSNQDNTETDYTDRRNINEFVSYKRQKKLWQNVTYKDKDNRFNAYHWNYTQRSDPEEAKKEATKRIQQLKDSLLARGNPRETKPYNPPEGIEERVLSLFKSSQIMDEGMQKESNDDMLNTSLHNRKQLKFNLIARCIEEFNHHMPSPYLNEMNCVRDVVDYFSTPVRGLNPYSAMLRQETSLPTNLSLLSEPERYNKDSDTYFGGFNALPGIISRVPGVRAGKKYPVLNQDEFQWPDI